MKPKNKIILAAQVIEMMLLLGIDTIDYSKMKKECGSLEALHSHLFSILINNPIAI